MVRMQVADSTGTNDANYVHAAVTLENVGWNTVTFDFSSPAERWVAANEASGSPGLNANVTYRSQSSLTGKTDWIGKAIPLALH